MDQAILFSIARTSIMEIVINGKKWLPELVDDWLIEKKGVFTTLYSHKEDKRKLRGCIGVPHPTESLGHAVAISARQSATKDPRFPPVGKQEISDLSLSLEILGIMEKVEYSDLDELKDKITLGKDGLMIKYITQGGILLPRVPIEHNFSKQEFLEAISRKAGLHISILLDEEMELYKFSSQYFEEQAL